MTSTEWLPDAIRGIRRRPIVADGTGVSVSFGVPEISRLLPHRPPMLLLESIDVVDLDARAVRGHRTLRAGDLGFEGHFPGDAIYPGVLLIEMMGQLGITLIHFVGGGTITVPIDAAPPRVRATHIHHATFLAPTRPGDELTLHAAVVMSNELTMIASTQVFTGDTLAAYAVAEVYVDE
ncbi:MAG TPA: 3-hydroxyacyl-ACP dehydratase FabZ family protein [Gemmatimonadaceae bacterium]